MTDEHLSALLALAEGKEDEAGWFTPADGRHLTLYLAHAGASLSVSRVDGLKRQGSLLVLRTVKGESYVVDSSQVFAGHVDAASKQTRKAGFASAG